MEELIKPNWHIAIVHFPIGLILLGAVLELFSFLGWRRTSLRAGGRWMLLAGAILAVPAAFSGIYALSDVLPQGTESVRATDPGLADYLRLHVWTQSAATALAMVIVTSWIALSDGWRDRLSLFFKASLILLVGLLGFGSHVGGEQVYEHGLAVEKEIMPHTLPSTTQLAELDTWKTLFPTEQNHVVIAGLAMAAACVCLGLAARATHFEESVVSSEVQIASVFSTATSASLGTADDAYVPYVSPINHTPPVRVGRLWAVAWVLLLLSSISGLAILAIDAHTIDFHTLWDSIRLPIEDNDPGFTRRFAHALTGGVIVIDGLILALLSRFARRRATVLAVFALPLILAMAAQIWLGTLLMLDGPSGPVTRFVH